MRSKTYQKRLSSVNKSINPEKNINALRFYLGGGNNSGLVRKVLSTRRNWEQVYDSKFLFTNFKWQQTSKGYNYDNCVDTKVFKHCLNHFQFHQELSNKQYLLKNLTQYCEANKLNVFDYVPVTYVLNLSDSNFDHNQTQFLKFFDQNIPADMKKSERKHWLTLPRRKLSSTMERKHSNYYAKPQLKSVFTSQDSQFLWLLKPSFRNCGKGIHVFNKISTLQNLMRHYIQQNSSSNSMMLKSMIQNETTQSRKKQFRIKSNIQYLLPPTKSSNYSFVIQKYLQRPLLIDGRKFDIRVWVLFTHELKVYFFKEGYVRTSSSAYSLRQDNFQNINIHLTNNAIQKYGQNYGKFEEGNQLSFKFLSHYISRRGGNFSDVLSQMKKIIKMTALSVKKKINKSQRQWCFQIFGYDFMIDQELKPWLIEANTNPCIEESSLILQNLLPRMLDDAFKLTLDQIFFQSKQGHKTPYVLQNYENNDNIWQLLVDLKKH